jgi:hypothetical protein
MKEFFERVALAIAILRGRDTKLVRYVRAEVGRVDRDAMLGCTNVARVFALEGHTVASAGIVIPWIQRTLSWEPIAPLTGETDEWVDIADHGGRPLLQNQRCSRVFLEPDTGRAYDISGVIWENADGARFTNRESHVDVLFPYMPSSRIVKVRDSSPL